MLLHTALLFANLYTVGDTVGVKEVFREAIASVVRQTAASNEWGRTAEYFIVNIPSFENVTGIDPTDDAGWHVVIDSLGNRGKTEDAYCQGPRDHVCPHIWAQSMTRTGNTFHVIVMIDYQSPVVTARKPNTQMMQWRVTVTRIGAKYRLDSVTPGLIS